MVVQIQPPRASVHLHGNVEAARRAEDFRHIDRVRPPPPQLPPRGVAEHVHERVLHGPDDAIGHARRGHVEDGVDRREDHVQFGQDFVVEVQGAVGQDVHFAATQDADVGMVFLDARDLGGLRPERRSIHAGDHPGRGGVVGDRDVLVPPLRSRPHHAPNRGGSVAPGRVHVEVARDVAALDQAGKAAAGPRQGGGVLAQLRRDPGQVQRRVHRLLRTDRSVRAAEPGRRERQTHAARPVLHGLQVLRRTRQVVGNGPDDPLRHGPQPARHAVERGFDRIGPAPTRHGHRGALVRRRPQRLRLGGAHEVHGAHDRRSPPQLPGDLRHQSRITQTRDRPPGRPVGLRQQRLPREGRHLGQAPPNPVHHRRPEPVHPAKLAAGQRLAELLDRVDPGGPERARPRHADPVQAQHLGQPRRNPRPVVLQARRGPVPNELAQVPGQPLPDPRHPRQVGPPLDQRRERMVEAAYDGGRAAIVRHPAAVGAVQGHQVGQLRHQPAEPGVGHRPSSEDGPESTGPFPRTSSSSTSSSFSSSTSTPSRRAFSSFDPGFAPVPRISVRPLTEPVTRAPRASSSCFHSPLERD